VQTCSQCNQNADDTVQICPHCQADLTVYSKTAVALQRFQENPRVFAVTLITHGDSCPACQDIQGTYPKDGVPKLPIEGCSHPNGCRCFYLPMLETIFP
jgi:hypothetical protein